MWLLCLPSVYGDYYLASEQTRTRGSVLVNCSLLVLFVFRVLLVRASCGEGITSRTKNTKGNKTKKLRGKTRLEKPCEAEQATYRNESKRAVLDIQQKDGSLEKSHNIKFFADRLRQKALHGLGVLLGLNPPCRLNMWAVVQIPCGQSHGLPILDLLRRFAHPRHKKQLHALVDYPCLRPVLKVYLNG